MENIYQLQELGPYLHKLIKANPSLSFERVSEESIQRHYTNLRRKLLQSSATLVELDKILSVIGVDVIIKVNDAEFSRNLKPTETIQQENEYIKRIDALQQEVIRLQNELIQYSAAPKP